MTIHLPEDIEAAIVDAVRRGRFDSVDDALAAAWRAFEQPGRDQTATGPMTEAAFKQRLIAAGLMTELPVPADPATRPDLRPAPVQGEPLAETIVRERR